MHVAPQLINTAVYLPRLFTQSIDLTALMWDEGNVIWNVDMSPKDVLNNVFCDKRGREVEYL